MFYGSSQALKSQSYSNHVVLLSLEYVGYELTKNYGNLNVASVYSFWCSFSSTIQVLPKGPKCVVLGLPNHNTCISDTTVLDIRLTEHIVTTSPDQTLLWKDLIYETYET